MITRRSFLAAACCLAIVGCAPAVRSGPPPGTDRTDPSTTTTYGQISPPPAQLLDATVVHIDPDGTDEQPTAPPVVVITDAGALDAFADRFVDGAPALGPQASEALAAGQVLIGGVVSSGCFPAPGATLAFTAVEVLLLPDGLPRADPELTCVRAITSIAVLAIDTDELPGLPIRGT